MSIITQWREKHFINELKASHSNSRTAHFICHTPGTLWVATLLGLEVEHSSF